MTWQALAGSHVGEMKSDYSGVVETPAVPLSLLVWLETRLRESISGNRSAWAGRQPESWSSEFQVVDKAGLSVPVCSNLKPKEPRVPDDLRLVTVPVRSKAKG